MHPERASRPSANSNLQTKTQQEFRLARDRRVLARLAIRCEHDDAAEHSWHVEHYEYTTIRHTPHCTDDETQPPYALPFASQFNQTRSTDPKLNIAMTLRVFKGRQQCELGARAMLVAIPRGQERAKAKSPPATCLARWKRRGKVHRQLSPPARTMDLRDGLRGTLGPCSEDCAKCSCASRVRV